jgi:hypothetical protein
MRERKGVWKSPKRFVLQTSHRLKAGTPYRVRFRGSMREDFTWENSLPEEREPRIPIFNESMHLERSSRFGFAARQRRRPAAGTNIRRDVW